MVYERHIRLCKTAPTTRKHHYSRRGVAAVEMALILPVFFLVVFGIIEFGRAMSASNIITSACRLGARASILDNASNATVTQKLKSFCEATLDVSPDDVVVSIVVVAAPESVDHDPANEIANAKQGDLCTIRVEIPYDKISLTPAKFLSGKNLSASCSMEHE